MSNIPTCAVRAIFRDSEGGEPIAGATVTARLSSYEVYQGYVVPQEVEAVTDADGHAILNLWPNELGAVESFYRITLDALDRKLRTTAVVPNVVEIDLHLIAELPPYEGKNDGQSLIEEAIAASLAALAARDAAEASAVSADASADAAAASAASIVGAVDASAASAASALASANSATASASAASASQTAAAASQSAAAGSATTATTGATTATTQAGIATTQAGTATTQAGIAATQAGIATGQATASASSASASQAAAQAAADSALDAAGDADEAGTFASNAAASAGVALGHANAAEQSAIEAQQAADEAGLTGANVNGSGRLIVARGDGTTYDAGYVVGPQGPIGASITPKGSVPTVGDLPATGNALNDAYTVQASGRLYVWTTALNWQDMGQFQGPAGTTDYNALANKPTLGSAAPLDVAAAGNATATQVVKGNDGRLSDARAPTAHSHAASDISDSTAIGRALMTVATALAARQAIGAGTSNFSGSWGDLTDKPAVIAAGENTADARAAIDLGNVNNTADSAKPVSTAQQTALNLKSDITTTTTKDSSTGASNIPVGTTAQRPASGAGKFRFNSSTGRFEGNNGTAWGSLGGATGGGNDAVFYLNSTTITTSYAIPGGQNAMAAGPITINAGAVIDIPDGSTLTIV